MIIPLLAVLLSVSAHAAAPTLQDAQAFMDKAEAERLWHERFDGVVVLPSGPLCSAMDQPMIFREHRSITPIRYSQPSPVWMYVMSHSHAESGFWAVNF